MAAVFRPVKVERERRSSVLHAFRVLLALALLGILFFRFIDRESFLDSVRHVDGRFIALTLAAYILWRIASTWQITYLLRRCGVAIGFWRLFRVQTIGILFSTALPSDFAGAAATWYMLSKDTGKRAIIANSLIHVRLLSLAVVAAFAYVGLLVDPAMASLPGARFAALFAAGMFVCLVIPLSSMGLNLVERICMTLLAFTPKWFWIVRLRNALTSFFSEAHSVRRLPLLSHLILWGAALFVNFAAALIVFAAMRATAISLTFAVSIWLVALIAIVQIIPITPGGLGVREASIIAVLKSAYGVIPEKALAFATLILAFNLVLGVGLGGYWFVFSKEQSR